MWGNFGIHRCGNAEGRLFRHETAASLLREERGQSRATGAAKSLRRHTDSSWDKKRLCSPNEFKGCRSGFVKEGFPLCRRAFQILKNVLQHSRRLLGIKSACICFFTLSLLSS